MFYVVLMNLKKEEDENGDIDSIFSIPAEIYKFGSFEESEAFYLKHKEDTLSLVKGTWRAELDKEDLQLVFIDLSQVYKINSQLVYISFFTKDLNSSNILIADEAFDLPETDAQLFKLFMDWFSNEDDIIIDSLSVGDHHDNSIEDIKNERYVFFNYLTYMFAANLIDIRRSSEITQK